MKRALALLASLSPALLPLADRSARADTAAPAPTLSAKASPLLHALPQSQLGELIVPAIPERILAKEKAEGFQASHPAEPPRPVVPGSTRRRETRSDSAPTMVLVSSSQAAIQRMFGGVHEEPSSTGQPEPVTCFALTSESREKPAELARWMGSFSPVVTLPAWSAAREYFGRVRLVRSERLSRGEGGQATLEIAHAWVDTESLGVRLIDKARVALSEIQAGPGGLHVYAARDGRRVLFVLRPPDAAPDRGMPSPLMFTGTDGVNGSSQCGHLALRLHADRIGDAQLTTVTGELAAPREAEGASPDFGREFQVRGFRLTLSESWMSLDPEPVLATSFGWSGKARSEIR